jgi:hypothetical protein
MLALRTSPQWDRIRPATVEAIYVIAAPLQHLSA